MRKDAPVVLICRWPLVFLALLSLQLAIGCAPKVKDASEDDAGNASGKEAAVESGSSAGAKAAPRDLLLNVLKNYQTTGKYSDEGIVRLKFSQRGQVVEEKWPCRVAFDRTGNLAVDAFQAKVRLANQKFSAQIEDSESNNLDNQIVERPLQGTLTLHEFMVDPVLGDILASQLRRQPLQLELLLDPATLEAVVSPGAGLKSRGMESFDGHSCQLIELMTPSGAYVFWVDPKALLIRRLDYPVTSLVPELATNPDVQGLRLSAELAGAKFGAECKFGADTFTLAVPAGAKVMRSFVVPPRPLPSKLFGKLPDDFWFTKLGGARISRDDLRGKITVLVWFRNHPACVATLQQLEQARRELGEKENVQFFAVNTDDGSVSDEALQKLLFGWDVQLEPVRDFEAFGDKAFQIAVQPTVIVLSPDLKVQVYQPGGNPLLANQMVVIAERLLAGDKLDQEILSRADSEKVAYDKLVKEGGPALDAKMPETPPGEVALHQPLLPQNLVLEPLWQLLRIPDPGNLYWSTAGDKQRILVLDGTRRVIEIDVAGEVVARHDLELPKEAGVTYLREARTKEGQPFYIAGAPGATELYWFDEQWKPMGSYPPAGTLRARIFDVCVMPQAGEDDYIAIGFGDLLGIHVVTSDQKVKWKSRACPTVTSLAKGKAAIAMSRATDEASWLLAVGEGGEAMPLSADGTAGKWQRHEKLSLGRLVNSGFPIGDQSPLLGIALDEKGSVFALGLDFQMKDHWRIPLPQGGHQVPIEPIVSGKVRANGAGDWLIASPDGCIHIISEDGKFKDKFAVGQALKGICVGNDGLVVYSSDSRIDAVRIKVRP